mgnify:CR=1 FL=1
MKYMNVVKFKVKKKYLIEFEKKAYQEKKFHGQLHEYFVKTGDYDFVAVGLWESEEKMVYPGLLSLEKLHFEHHASMRQRSKKHTVGTYLANFIL